MVNRQLVLVATWVVMGIAHRSWLAPSGVRINLRRVLRRAGVPVLVVPVVAGAQIWPAEPVVEPIGSRVWTGAAVDRIAA